MSGSVRLYLRELVGGIYDWLPLTSINGSVPVAVMDSSGLQVSDFSAGPYPETWTIDFTFSGTVAALGLTSVISSFSKGTFTISGLATETISVTGMIGAAQTLETAAFRCIDVNTGALTASSALGNGTYRLVDLEVYKLKFAKSGAVDNATITLTLKA